MNPCELMAFLVICGKPFFWTYIAESLIRICVGDSLVWLGKSYIYGKDIFPPFFFRFSICWYKLNGDWPRVLHESGTIKPSTHLPCSVQYSVQAINMFCKPYRRGMELLTKNRYQASSENTTNIECIHYKVLRQRTGTIPYYLSFCELSFTKKPISACEFAMAHGFIFTL